MISKSLGKIGLALGLTSILVVSLLAGCGSSTTITATATKTVTGSGSTVTATATTTIGAGSTVTVTGGSSTTTVMATVGGAGATTTRTVTTTAAGGTGAVMGNLLVYGGIVTSVGCLETGIAHRGELIVWRMRIVDPQTGKDMTDKEVKSANAVLPDGQKFAMTYGGHPGGGTPTDYFWSGIWEVPLTYPTGSLGYEIQAVANDGRTGSFKDFEVAASKLNIAAFDPAFVRNWSVNITATGFSVATLTISQGAKVTFSNRDAIPHKVTGDGWDSGDIGGAVGTTYKTFARVFSTAGIFVVKDAANPAFTVTITVNAVS